ncbi:MAG: NAD(P)-dependent glycerol-3-phosphate dehydrogenase [PVC group bacterium]|nr:NAD(P)-dependent glycerol-3-phosphate dehydrogenase [PVC group bacterium]
MNISIIGDGGWGTALALLLTRKGFKVMVWGAFPEYTNLLTKKRENVKFLPGIKIPKQVLFTNDLKLVLNKPNLVILAVPSKYLKNVLKKIKRFKIAKFDFLTVVKGIDETTKLRMSQIIRQELGNVSLAVLSGPNIATEVARGIPSASVCSSRNKRLSAKVQDIFMSKFFRVYTNTDVAGVELGGALKNIIAIACGISDGLGFGTNTKAALLTRGLAEISRLGVSMGAKSSTFSGLSGMGDLVTTCLSQKSRNRWLGEELGKGRKLKTILKQTEMVVEGVTTTKSALKTAKHYKVEMPITREVYKVLFQGKDPRTAVQSLMVRKKRQEG